MLHSLIARRRVGPQTQWRPLLKILNQQVGAWRYVFGLARRGSTICFHLLWHTVELAMSTRLCLSWRLIWFLCFRFEALTELGLFMRTEFLCISILNVASDPRVTLASCKSALTPAPSPPRCYCCTSRSKAVVPVLVLLFVALWFNLQGYSFYVLPCVILFLCFSVHLALRLPRLGKRELILVFFVRLFDLRLFGFVCFLFLLVSWKSCVCNCCTLWTFLLFVCFLFLIKVLCHRSVFYLEIFVCILYFVVGLGGPNKQIVVQFV